MLKSINRFLWELRHPVSNSRHLQDYEEIALLYEVTVRRVYRLAHGWHSENHNEIRVVDELIQRGILQCR